MPKISGSVVVSGVAARGEPSPPIENGLLGRGEVGVSLRAGVMVRLCASLVKRFASSNAFARASSCSLIVLCAVAKSALAVCNSCVFWLSASCACCSAACGAVSAAAASSAASSAVAMRASAASRSAVTAVAVRLAAERCGCSAFRLLVKILFRWFASASCAFCFVSSASALRNLFSLSLSSAANLATLAFATDSSLLAFLTSLTACLCLLAC